MSCWTELNSTNQKLYMPQQPTKNLYLTFKSQSKHSIHIGQFERFCATKNSFSPWGQHWASKSRVPAVALKNRGKTSNRHTIVRVCIFLVPDACAVSCLKPWKSQLSSCFRENIQLYHLIHLSIPKLFDKTPNYWWYSKVYSINFACHRVAPPVSAGHNQDNLFLLLTHQHKF